MWLVLWIAPRTVYFWEMDKDTTVTATVYDQYQQ